MLQAAALYRLFLYPSPFPDDVFVPAEVDIGRRYVVQALVVALVIVIVDKGPDLHLEIAGQVVVLQQDPVLHGLVPAFNLALGLRMEGRTPDVIDLLVVQPCCQVR